MDRARVQPPARRGGRAPDADRGAPGSQPGDDRHSPARPARRPTTSSQPRRRRTTLRRSRTCGPLRTVRRHTARPGPAWTGDARRRSAGRGPPASCRISPRDGALLSTSGPGPFVTRARLRRPDGSEVEWTSRRHRKRLGLRLVSGRSRPLLRRGGGVPSAASWWMGGLFAIGSICFALGSTRLYFDHVQPAVVAATFFVGSLFFTAASALQYHETRSAPTGIEPGSPRRRGLRVLLGATRAESTGGQRPCSSSARSSSTSRPSRPRAPISRSIRSAI